MTWMDQLVYSGGIAYVAMLFIAVEVLLIAFLLRARDRLKSLLPTILSGFFLICAANAALTNAASIVVAFWFLAAMIAHIVDMTIRLTRYKSRSR